MPKVKLDEIKIVDYQPSYRVHFEKLNKAWLEEYFSVEPVDKKVLEHPQENIIDQGGAILFARKDGSVIGTVALKPVELGVLELTKMAVDKKFQGMGTGKLLCEAAIEKAYQIGAFKLILYSNTKLETAISLYRKMGFMEIPLKKGAYGRADIMMEKSLV